MFCPRVALSLLACLLASSMPTAQQEPARTGLFEPAFNHQVPEHWKKGQPGWDGEPDSPYRIAETPTRFMAAHMSLIPRGPFQGQLLTWNHMRVMLGEQYWAIVDPVNQKFLNFSMPSGSDDEDIFCSGHAWTKAGDLFVAGGNLNINGWISASQRTYRFVPSNEPGSAMWVREPDLAIARWYPTVCSMGTDAAGNDLILVVGGTHDTEGREPFKSYEAFNPAGAPGSGSWQSNPSAEDSRVFEGPPNLRRAYQFGIYPRTTLLSDGSLFFSGMSGLTYRLNHFNFSAEQAPYWDVEPKNPFRAYIYSNSLLLPNLGGPGGGHMDIVMRTAGLDIPIIKHVPQAPPFLPGPPWPEPASTTQWIRAGLSAEDPNWQWQRAQDLSFARARSDATLLPDATVLCSGGKRDTEVEINCGLPVLPNEIFDAASKTWRTDASAQVRRGYHSAAALLPDGRVLIGGGEAREMDYELYRPPYLTDGSQRARILNQAPPGAAWEWGYDQTQSVSYEIDAAVKVLYGVLMAPASTTHHFDMHQRYVELERLPQATSSRAGGLELRLKTPPNSKHAPKGYYMLFLVTEPQGQSSTGTPSMAAWVKLG